jgi:hypothetical protein
MSSSNAATQIATAFAALLAICYLSVRGRGTHTTALTWIGGFALLPAVALLCVEGWGPIFATHITFTGTEAVLGWAGVILIPLVFAFVYRGTQVWMNAVAAAWIVALTFIADAHSELAIYAMCAIGAAGLIVWGIHESRPERINLGMAGFFITLIVFFFSSVMDKLGRSLSLIVLGIVLLAGGWYGEKLRRKLVARAHAGGAQ